MILNNRVISVLRLTETWGKKTYTNNVAADVPVYIEPLRDEVIVNNESVWAYDWYKLMCEFTDLIVWDKITDDNATVYKVKWIKLYDTIIDKHVEAIIQTIYD